MKDNYLEEPCGSWNPHPSAFYEGELWRSFAGAGILILVHFNEGELLAEALLELESLS